MPKGVLIINNQNRAFHSPLLPTHSAAGKPSAPVAALPPDIGPLSFGPAPQVAGNSVYWVRERTLYGQALTPPEAVTRRLAEDVLLGTQISALSPNTAPHTATWVAYIATTPSNPGRPVAKLWYNNAERAGASLVLTEPGAAAQSVKLAQTVAGTVYALSLEARLGMTTVHSRQILSGDPPALGSDHILWVGGTAQARTELALVQAHGRTFALVALERDIAHFGLALLDFASLSTGEPQVTWSLFENGTPTTPVAAAEACGETWVLFARPRSAQPHAALELVVSRLQSDGLTRPVPLAEAKAILDVTMASVPGGALITYVTDTHTHALSVRCTQ
jgi:hypothetical protein